MDKKPDLIVVDGPDGCGKTTQIGLLAKELKKRPRPVNIYRDPGETEIGEKIRSLLLSNENENMTSVTEMFLYMASRAQLVEECIRPDLNDGEIVLLDRFYYSTLAYQGIAGDVGFDNVMTAVRTATDGIQPDLTLLLDIPAEEGLKRIGKEMDRMEQKSIEYHRKVRQGFLKIGEKFKDRTEIIDATRSSEQIHEEIKDILGL